MEKIPQMQLQPCLTNQKVLNNNNNQNVLWKTKIKIYIALFLVIVIAAMFISYQFRCQNTYYPDRPFTQSVTYFWIGDDNIPQQYVNKLQTLLHPYKLITNCHEIIEQGQKIFGQFIDKTMNGNRRLDLCRFIWLYINGGAYSDLDAIINMSCFEQIKKQKNPQYLYAYDIYFMYQRDPKSKRMRQTLQKYNEFIKTTGLHYPPEYLQFGASGKTEKDREVQKCLEHHYGGSWRKFTNESQYKNK